MVKVKDPEFMLLLNGARIPTVNGDLRYCEGYRDALVDMGNKGAFMIVPWKPFYPESWL